MTGEFEVSTGHLLVVGGRAVRLTPPGALVESAPRRAPRIREGDTFFILVTPTGEEHASAAFYEELAHVAANAYFMSGGGVTGGLREAPTAIASPGRIGATRAPACWRARRSSGADLFAASAGRPLPCWPRPVRWTAPATHDPWAPPATASISLSERSRQ